jgi:hypothetical protein
VSAGGLSKTAQRDLRSMTDHDDRLWRLACQQGRNDARRPRRRWSLGQVWALVMVIGLVGNLAWPYRYWISAGLAAVVWIAVVWLWRARGRLQRWLGRRWLSVGRF